MPIAEEAVLEIPVPSPDQALQASHGKIDRDNIVIVAEKPKSKNGDSRQTASWVCVVGVVGRRFHVIGHLLLRMRFPEILIVHRSKLELGCSLTVQTGPLHKDGNDPTRLTDADKAQWDVVKT